MGLFRPYQRDDSPRETGTGESKRIGSLTPRAPQPEAEPPATAASSPARPAERTVVQRTPQKKETPTRTRRQAEAERMERLHPSLSPKQQRRADRDARAKARMDTWDRVEAMPERALARDYVDTRWTINEFMLPAMILVMAGVMFTVTDPLLSSSIALGLWVLLAMALINTIIMWRGFKKVLATRLPNANTRGLLMYMFNRSLMIRRFRRPAPRIERGASV